MSKNPESATVPLHNNCIMYKPAMVSHTHMSELIYRNKSEYGAYLQNARMQPQLWYLVPACGYISWVINTKISQYTQKDCR